MDAKGDVQPVKPFVPASEIPPLPLTEKMSSILKGQGLVRDGVPIVHVARPKRKQRNTKMRRTKGH